MTHIVGLDLSLTSTGIAVLSTSLPTDRAAAGYESYPVMLRAVGEDGKRDDDYRKRSRRVRRTTRAVLDDIANAAAAESIDLAIIEGPLYGVKIMPSYFDRAALFHGVYGALDARGVPIAVVPPTTGHQFVTGKGHAEKVDIVAETSKWWPGCRIPNDDVADALGLAVMGAMHLGHRPPFRPGIRHHNAVHTVTWPGKRDGD